MRVTMLLADSAQAINGKLYLLGGGWSIVGPEPTATAIAIKIDVPWDEANRKHNLEIALLTGDGHPVVVHTPVGEQAVKLGGEFEVGRPPGLRAGSSIDMPLAFNIGPLPLQPDSRFVWRVSIDGSTKEEWQVVFSTRPDTQPPQQKG